MNHLRTLSLGKNATKTATTRRQLLKAFGASAALSPFVPTLDAWAQGNAPVRLLLVFTPDGIVPDKWWPTGSETAWNFPADGIMAPLNAHKPDMIFFKDMPRFNGGSGGAHEHAMGGLWTGNSINANQAMAPSVDQIIASKLPKVTDFQSLQFGVQSFFNAGDANAKAASVNSYMIYSGPRARMPAESDPYKAFDRVFGTFKPPAGGPTPPSPVPDNMDRVRAEKKSVLDFITADLEYLKGKVGKDDVSKIDAHHDTIRDIERRLSGTNPATGGVVAECKVPGKAPMIDLNSNASHPMLCEVVPKLVVATLACDRTRIASLQFARGFSNAVHSWVGARETHHTLSHGTQNAPVLAKIQHFYMGYIAKMVDELKAIKEQGKPMLDNMLMVYGNEVYLGWTHGVSPEPCFWLGKAGGKIKSTGRFLDFAGKFDHNQMLQTMTHIMGTPVDKVGDLGKPGILPGIIS